MEDNVLQVAELDICADGSQFPAAYRIYNAWQCCPICGGAGKVTPTGITSATFEACTVCRGKKIISTLTGLPPGPSI